MSVALQPAVGVLQETSGGVTSLADSHIRT